MCCLQEDRLPMEPVVSASFPVLLPMLQQLLAAPANSGSQVRTACSGRGAVPHCCCFVGQATGSKQGPCCLGQHNKACNTGMERPCCRCVLHVVCGPRDRQSWFEGCQLVKQRCPALAALCRVLQVPEFIKLICKVFWSATFMTIPQLLVQQEHFQGWMMAFHTAMRKPLPWVRRPWYCCLGMPVWV
jgi:hypothetical protein